MGSRQNMLSVISGFDDAADCDEVAFRGGMMGVFSCWYGFIVSPFLKLMRWPENSTLAWSRSCLSDIFVVGIVDELLLLVLLVVLSFKLKCGVFGRL